MDGISIKRLQQQIQVLLKQRMDQKTEEELLALEKENKENTDKLPKELEGKVEKATDNGKEVNKINSTRYW